MVVVVIMVSAAGCRTDPRSYQILYIVGLYISVLSAYERAKTLCKSMFVQVVCALPCLRLPIETIVWRNSGVLLLSDGSKSGSIPV